MLFTSHFKKSKSDYSSKRLIKKIPNLKIFSNAFNLPASRFSLSSLFLLLLLFLLETKLLLEILLLFMLMMIFRDLVVVHIDDDGDEGDDEDGGGGLVYDYDKNDGLTWKKCC